MDHIGLMWNVAPLKPAIFIEIAIDRHLEKALVNRALFDAARGISKYLACII